MKAAFFRKHGGPEVMEYGEIADPVVLPGQVMVDIHAASVNGADWKVRKGSYAPITDLPYIPGRDFSGVVSALGEGVKEFAVGDEVFGVCDVGQEQAYAEKIAIKASIVAKKPANLSHEECAALALIGLTALCSVEDTLQLKKGETILIQGGAGGVASYAIQLAKHIGARVITTARADNHDYLRKLGADQIIDYNAQDFTKVVSGCDAVFDTVGGDVTQRSFAVLRPGGRAASIAAGQAAHGRISCAGVAARGCYFATAQGRPRPAAPRTHRRARHQRRGACTRDEVLQTIRSGCRASTERRTAFPWQAGV